MFTDLAFTLPSLQQWLIAAGILVVAWAVSTIVLFIMKRSKRLTSMTKTTVDDEILKLMTRPVHLGFQLIGIIVALRYLFPDLSYQDYNYNDLVPILVIVWIAYSINRVVKGFMQWQEQEASKVSAGQIKHGTFGFLNTIVSMLVWGLALAFILNQVGIDISALLAGLGIAGLAVALALQSTLSGLFSAVGLALDRPIRQGDFVKLEDGTEGFVEDISMRSTRIRTFDNSIVIVPNGRLTEMVIVNTYLPEAEITLKVVVGVSYDSDLDKAEKISIEVAKDVLEAQGVKGSKDPFVRFSEFGDSAIEMKVFLSVATFLDQFVVRHEFIKAIKKQFKKERIEIPYPQMDVHVHK